MVTAPDRPGQQRYFDGTTRSDSYAEPTLAPAGTPNPGRAKKILVPLLACLALGLLATIGAALVATSDDKEPDVLAGSSTTRRPTTTEGVPTTTPRTTRPTTTAPPTTRPTTLKRPGIGGGIEATERRSDVSPEEVSERAA